MKSLLEKFLLGKMLKSKKFWYAVIGCITTLLSDTFNLNPEEVNNILMSIGALIVGQGLADFGKDAN
tara:strand:- start:1665 stop:1865 length:201 start_codon:yes stop_codon:yes gene_type:complete